MSSSFGKLFGISITGATELFTYQELSQSAKEIRLLRRDIDVLGVSAWSLEHWSLATAPPYRALSYAWGSEDDRTSILLGGKVFFVRRNLYDFLATVDYERTGPYLWVDQLCINQSAMNERNHQVSIMADIYRNAFEVMLWLGAETESSQELIQFITTYEPVASEALKDVGVFDVVPPRRDLRYTVSSNGRRLFDDLYRREYWTRLWPVQEILLARRLVIYLGKFRLAWDILRRFHTWMIHTTSDFNVEYDGLTFLFQNALRREPCDYSSLIQPVVQNRCADPRDKLYGLMSLLPPEMIPTVDYAQSVEVTFIAAARIVFVEWQRNQQLVQVELAVALEKCLMLGHAMLPDKDWQLDAQSKTHYYDMARYIADTHLSSDWLELASHTREGVEPLEAKDAADLAIRLLTDFVHSADTPLMRFLHERRPRVQSGAKTTSLSRWFDD